MSYSIVRFFQDGDSEVIQTGLTLAQAQKHCKDPETSSKTCSSTEGMERTRKQGEWFDGYKEE